MKFKQLVYGRVARGLSGAGGYQIAAASDSLQDQPDVLEWLKSISFYPEVQRGKPSPPRYAFASGGKDLMSFSRTAVAKDLSGAVGYFSHHLVVTREEVFACGSFPFQILRAHAFFQSEQDLPENRILPELEIDMQPPEPLQADQEEYSWILTAADELIRSSSYKVPTLITVDLDTPEILLLVEHIFALLPLSKCLQFSFCTNFIGSAENLSCYRFISAPEESLLKPALWVALRFVQETDGPAVDLAPGED